MNISYNPGLYLHIPFCQSKCGYCDFYSSEDLSSVNNFVASLITEINLTAQHISTTASFDTIYLGGGTPSLLDFHDLELIVNTLKENFYIAEDSEITIEVNPGTISFYQLKQMINLGINRISIGVQSFIDHELLIADRIHNSGEAEEAIASSQEAGFKNINIDLIFALPGQTLQDWHYSLNKAVSFQPQHLSVYNLSYEKGTPFYKKKLKLEFIPQTEESEVLFFESGHNYLTGKSFIHYEVSNYARSGKYISRHNFKYWNHTPYLGFGPSAHSFWSKSRWSNVRSVTKYIDILAKDKLPHDYYENLTHTDLLFEYIFLSLRTYDGIDLKTFAKKFKQSFEKLFPVEILDLINQNLARYKNNHFQLTEKGMLICDEILPLFSKH